MCTHQIQPTSNTIISYFPVLAVELAVEVIFLSAQSVDEIQGTNCQFIAIGDVLKSEILRCFDLGWSSVLSGHV